MSIVRSFCAAVWVSVIVCMASFFGQAALSLPSVNNLQFAHNFTESLHLQIDSQLTEHKRKPTLLIRTSLRINPYNKNSKWHAQKGQKHYAAITQHNLLQQSSALIVAFAHYLRFPNSQNPIKTGDESNLIYRFIHDK